MAGAAGAVNTSRSILGGPWLLPSIVFMRGGNFPADTFLFFKPRALLHGLHQGPGATLWFYLPWCTASGSGGQPASVAASHSQ